jgi:hypothetical protein
MNIGIYLKRLFRILHSVFIEKKVFFPTLLKESSIVKREKDNAQKFSAFFQINFLYIFFTWHSLPSGPGLQLHPRIFCSERKKYEDHVSIV